MKKTKITALLTGRGNNTLSDKNVREILGQPVLYYPAKAAENVDIISEYYCSSDCEKILKAAAELGYKSIVRPAELALPSSQHIDCILHALEEMKGMESIPDILVVLLANNVTVKSKWIEDCINIMIENPSSTAVVPVYLDNDHHPLRAKKVNGQGLLEMYEDIGEEKVSTNRQDLVPCYFLAHNFWVLDVKTLLAAEGGQQPWSFMGHNIYPYVIDESIDIHDEEDLFIASNWVKEKYND